MPYLIAAPDILAAAAADVARIGSSLSEANSAANAATTGMIAAGGDEVSVAIASLFSRHGRAFQALSAQAAAHHSQFAETLNACAGTYASTEAANALPLQLNSVPVPNIAVSVGGLTFRSGSATATSYLFPDIAIAIGANSSAQALLPGDIAIAIGSNSSAQASEGYRPFFNHAFAIGTNSSAEAVYGRHNTAIALGTNSGAVASANNHELACAVGTNSFADTYSGTFAAAFGPDSTATNDRGHLSMACAVGTHNLADVHNGTLNTAVALGAHNTAYAGGGNLDLACVLGAGSTASAGGTHIYPPVHGSFDVAFVLGAGSTAVAGASPTTAGNSDLAAAVGNMLDAAAVGANRLVDIAFQP